MRRLKYRCRRYSKYLKVTGIFMVVVGLILILKIVPIQIWIFILGLGFTTMGYFLYRM